MPNTVGTTATAAALVRLHEVRTREELDERFARDLAGLLPETDLAVCTNEADERSVVRFAVGARFRAAVGGDSAGLTPAVWLPIHFRGHRIGGAAVGRELGDAERAELADALAHYGTALANLTLGQEAQRDANEYFVILQALEQGIVLFQEEDAEALKARLLHQAMCIVEASAGALYVLREVGDANSGLALEQVLGIPEELVNGFRGRDGVAWPDALLSQPTQVLERVDGELPLLAPGQVPAVLRSIAVVPLSYHGVDAGLCLLFNPQTGAAVSREVAARLQSFGLLGAALLHRLRLEAVHAVSRSRERELQIAQTIQQRLLPSAAPVTPGFGYAWVLLTAQNIGGDYLDVFEARPGSVRGIVADASGHGINSALLMSSFRSTYRAKAPDQRVEVLAATLNEVVVDEVGPTGMFITAVMYELDCATRRMRLASAGHTPSMVFRARTGTVEILDSDGPPLGFLAGATYGNHEIRLESGDVVLLYTDGITEAANGELDMYGEERLSAVLRANAMGSADQLLAAVRRDVGSFCGRERYEDDLSLAVVRVE
ncbi:MAG: serine/threonine-protein phosphatase [Planctomycetes bacterium]|nr:serine/threonine-protein phosphatase [Planctomycetota bacterium]